MHRRSPHRLAFLILLAAIGCDPQDPAPIDATYDTPLLQSLRLSPSIINTDTILVGNERLPDDELSISIVASVGLARSTGTPVFSARILSGSGDRFTSTSSFNDAGIGADTIAGDGRYTSAVSFTVQRALTGIYALNVEAKDGTGHLSNGLSGTFSLVRQNQSPRLSNLAADTLVSLSGGNTTLLLTIDVADPDGREDIRRVWFDSYRPDGTPSSGNPFLMFDDGNSGGISGDRSANDGTYSLRIAFQGAALGRYKFSFSASDRSRDTSNVIDHFLSVVP